jgi:hypothetical protein
VSNGVLTIHAAGLATLSRNTDQFHLMTKQTTGDVQVSTELLTQSMQGATTNWGPEAGIMVRENNNSNSPFYAVLEYPENNPEGEPQPTLRIWYRTGFGSNAIQANRFPITPLPRWIMIQRHGDIFTTAESKDGTNWIVDSGSQTQVVMPATVMSGIAQNSQIQTTLGTATYSNWSVGPITVTPAPRAGDPGCQAGWQCQDIGTPSPVGGEAYNNGTWTIDGTGPQIGFNSDLFHYVAQTLTGDGTITARVTSQQNTSANAVAGLMMRQDFSSGSPYYGIFVTPGGAMTVQYRLHNNLRTFQIAPPTGKVPIWLRVTRYTDTSVSPAQQVFSAYTSTDGVNWTFAPWSSLVMPEMSGNVMAGMAADANANRLTSAVTYTNVALTTQSIVPPTICPATWTCGDVGYPQPLGEQVLQNGTWQLQGEGYDIWSNYDQLHFVSQTEPGDTTVSAHITGQTNTGTWAKAGVMLRATYDPGSPYYAEFMTPGNGIAIQYRSVQGGQTSQILLNGTLPAYLRIARWGDTSTTPTTEYFTAYTSTNGTTWQEIAGSSVALNMTGSILAGLAHTSHNTATLGMATFNGVQVLNSATRPSAVCPSGWTCSDIGGPTPAGSQLSSNNTWTIYAGGADIWGTTDAFRFIYQSVAANATVSAHITSQTNTDLWAKAGVMLRATNNPGSPYYAAFVTPGHGVAIQYRTAQGGLSTQVLTTGTVPTYLEVARYIDSSVTPNVVYFTAYTSTNGSTWTPIPGSTVTLNLTGPLLAGLAVTSHNSGALSVVGMDTVSISNTAPPVPQACAVGWTCADIGGATPAGGQTLVNGTWTVSGGGGDIWGTTDAFHYIWQSLATDGGVSAHITSQTNTDPWAKAGVMLRATNNPGSPYYAVFITPGNGVAVQYRTAQGGTSTQVLATGTVPLYLAVGRSGTTFTAYTSTDGSTWTPVPNSAVTLNMTGTLLAGLAVTSHSWTVASTVNFDTVQVGNGVP